MNQQSKKILTNRIVALAGITVFAFFIGIYVCVFSNYLKKYNTRKKLFGATYMTMNNEFYKIVNNQIRMQVEKNGNQMITLDPALDQKKQNEQIKQLQGFGNVRAFLMKKVCFFAAALLGSVLFLTVYQNAERSQILTQIKIPSYQLMMLPERAQEQVKKQYQELVAQVVPETFKMDQEAFKEHLEQLVVWEELKQELSLTESVQGAEEFVKALFLQVRAYQGIRIAWYHILFIVVISILAFQIPELFLVAEQWKSKEKRMSECLRLQTVVLLLIHYEKTTVEEILSQMENFAVLFQSQMAEAVDHFSYDRIRSLQKLKQEIPDEPVQRICDALEFCEELPVEEAFLNLEDEREYFLKKNMEERKNYQGECIALAKMAAYLPMFLLIILKLVVPFVAEGLSELHAYSQSMTGFF